MSLCWKIKNKLKKMNKKLTIILSSLAVLAILTVASVLIVLNRENNGGNLQIGREKNINQVQNKESVNSIKKMDTSNWLTYENVEYGYSLKYPHNWKIIENSYYEKDINENIKYVSLKSDYNNYSLTFLLTKKGENFNIGRTGIGAGDLREKEVIYTDSMDIGVSELIYVDKVREIFFSSNNNLHSFYGFFSSVDDVYGYNFNFDFTLFNVAENIIASLKFDEANMEQNNNCDSIADYGTSPQNATLFIYTTVCRSGNDVCSKSRPATINYYIRDFEGTFNKKLFTSNNGRYSIKLSKNEDGFNIHGLEKDEYFFVDFSGNIKKSLKEEWNNNEGSKWKTGLLSPDKEKLAKINEFQNLEIVDIKTGDVENYEMTSSGLNGKFIDSWSSDSRYVYVAGGIYEFFAPAKLWRLDTKLKKLIFYDQLADKAWPAFVSHDNNIAIARDTEHFNVDLDKADNVETVLYALNLTTGNVEVFAKQDGSIGDFKKINSTKFYYNLWTNNSYQGSDIYVVNLETKKVDDFLKKSYIIYNNSNEENNFFVYKQNGEISVSFFNDKDKKNILGSSAPDECYKFEPGKEYASVIYAVYENKK